MMRKILGNILENGIQMDFSVAMFKRAKYVIVNFYLLREIWSE